MKNVALIIVPEGITETNVYNNVPAGADVSWHGYMPPVESGAPGGTIRLPGSIPYRGNYTPLLNSQLIMLRFSKSYTPNTIQNWLDGFGISPAILVAVWYDTFTRVVDGEVTTYVLRSWKVRDELLASYTIAQIKNQLRKYFPLDEGDEPLIERLAHWLGMAYVEFDGNDDWLDDTEQNE